MTWINEKERRLQNIEWKLTDLFGYGIAQKISKILSLPYRIEKKLIKIVNSFN